MKTRGLLVLAVLPLLLLCAWWLLGGSERAKPVPVVGGANAATQEQPRPTVLLKPDPDQAAAPTRELPASPAVTNDPETGHLWFRLVDADTNQPMATVECELWLLTMYVSDGAVSFKEAGYQDTDDRRRLPEPKRRETTNAEGLLKLTAVCDEWTDATAWGVALAVDEVHMLYPVPPGFEPAGVPEQVAAQVLALRTAPAARAVDVLVRKAPSLCGVVTIANQSPVPSARVFAFPVLPTKATHRWTQFLSFPYATMLREAAGALGLDRDAAPLDVTSRCQSGFDQWYESWLLGDLEQRQYPPAVRGASCWPVNGLAEWWEYSALAYQAECDAGGSFSLSGLTSGDWLVVALAPAQDPALRRVSLRGGQTRCDLTFTRASTGALAITLQNTDSSGVPPTVQVSVRRAGPMGDLPGDLEFPSGECYWDHDMAEEGASEPILFGGLIPGYWLVQATDNKDHFRQVEVRAGEVTQVELSVGDQALAVWQPEVKVQGRTLGKAALFILNQGGVTAECGANGPAAIELGAGDYVVMAPGLLPRRFALQPGEVRSEVIELVCGTITFSVDPEFTRLLNRQELDELILRVIILDEEGRETATLASLAQLFRIDDPEFDDIHAAHNACWTVPVGRYTWELVSDYNVIRGPLVVKEGHTHVHFSLNNLPGLGVLEILAPERVFEMYRCSGEGQAADGEAYASPDLTREHQGVVICRRAGISADQHLTMNTYSRPALASSQDYIHLSGGHRLYLVPPGDYVFKFGRNGQPVRRMCTCPGRLDIKDDDVDQTRPAKAAVDVIFPEIDGVSYSCRIYDSVGMDYDIDSGGQVRVYQGKIVVVIYRYWWGDDTELSSRLVKEFQVGPEGVTIDLGEFTYLPTMPTTITCKGRGDPGGLLDPWWCAGQGPSLYMLVALQPECPQLECLVDLSGPVHIVAEPGRLEFAHRGLMLPPGRYRAIPWRDAPPEFCHEFEVLPGKATEVVIQGG